MRVHLQVDGAEPLAKSLEERGQRLTGDLSPLLQAIAADWVTHFQANIQEAGRGEVTWPALRPATVHIRDYYGYGGADPRLIRGGDLLHSIQLLEASERSIVVGTRQTGSGGAAARILQDGGTATDKHGRTHDVQAFPFIFLTEQDYDDTLEQITTYFFGALAGA